MLYIYFDTLWGFLQDMLLSLNSWLVVAVVVIYGYGNLNFKFNWKHKKKQKEAYAAGRSGNARALRKQSKCGMIQQGEGLD